MALGNEIDTETERAEAAETAIDALITGLDTSLASQVASVVALTQSLASVDADLTDFQQSIGTGLVNEINRAKAAEVALQALIDAITGTNTIGQFVTLPELAAAIDAETTRATDAEDALGAHLATEVERAETAESALQQSYNALASEVAELSAGGITSAQLAAAVLVETERAEAAETSLQESYTALAAEVSGLSAGGVTSEQLVAAILVETDAREVVDTSLQGQITALDEQVSTLSAGVTPGQLAAAVLVEKTRAMSAESSIQGSVNALTEAVADLTAPAPGEFILINDGTISVNRVGMPQFFPSYLPGTLTASQLLYEIHLGEDYTVPANLAGSYASAGITATLATTLTLTVGGNVVATLVFPATSSIGTFSVSPQAAGVTGSLMRWAGPAAPDQTLANIRITTKLLVAA